MLPSESHRRSTHLAAALASTNEPIGRLRPCGQVRGAGVGPWTQTTVRIGIRSAPQMKSIAGTLRRTQPCDAGYSGMLFDPCTATPPRKYFGR